MHILVVDDTSCIVERLTQLLASNGGRVETASNGLDAFEKAQKNTFDLYIVDHFMPVMDGLSLVKNLKKKLSTSTTPILFMTTESISKVEELVEYPLFDALLEKPIDETSLFDALKQLFPQNSLRNSL